MKARRLWWTIRTILTPGGRKRADYARKRHIYAHVGENVIIQSRTIPLYPELICFHNNIVVARNVDFVTHDIAYVVLNHLPEEERKNNSFKEHIGCIEVCDHVFIGSNTVILHGVRIGPRVIIGAGSVVIRDCEQNSVYAGVPAKKVGSFDDFIEKRIRMEGEREAATTTHNQELTEIEVSHAWENFRQNHSTSHCLDDLNYDTENKF